MKFEIEHKASHREWDVAKIDAAEFIKFAEIFKDEDGHFDGYPTFVFEKTAISADEMWWVSDGEAETSSFTGGLARFEDGQYVHLMHGRKRDLGLLVRVEITLDDDLRDRLPA